MKFPNYLLSQIVTRREKICHATEGRAKLEFVCGSLSAREGFGWRIFTFSNTLVRVVIQIECPLLIDAFVICMVCFLYLQKGSC